MSREEAEDDRKEGSEEELLYQVEDVPSWYMCIFMGLQHYLLMVGSTVACPFLLAPALCMATDDPDQANIVSTLVFMSGIITILQSSVGTRLPIVQGASFSYLIPSLAILNLPQWKCPSPAEFEELSAENKTETWQVRMREIQGAIIFASLFEVFFGLTGLVGLLSKRLTPLTIAPAISLIGIALFRDVTVHASKNFIVSLATLTLLILLSQYMRGVKLSLPGRLNRISSSVKSGFPIFQVFSVLISVGVVWIVCSILTATDVLPPGDPARSDSKLKILSGSPWFRVPYPFQWGWPTVSLGAVLGLTCGVITSSVESIGDYCACATICKKPIPPPHALNRGILTEGLGCLLSGIWGSGNGSTSYSSNIGTIALTGVASRRVIQVAGLLMVGLSLVGKAGAVFLSLPDPILAGMFLYLFPLILAVGLGTLAEISLASSRNVFIVSFAIFIGLSVSQWSQANPGVIATGSVTADNLIQIILNTGMFLGGVIGFVLDNTVPGTNEERGINLRIAIEEAALVSGDTTYDLPFGMDFIRGSKLLCWLPISPTFNNKTPAPQAEAGDFMMTSIKN